jgi:hypothetical protein
LLVLLAAAVAAGLPAQNNNPSEHLRLELSLLPVLRIAQTMHEVGYPQQRTAPAGILDTY